MSFEYICTFINVCMSLSFDYTYASRAAVKCKQSSCKFMQAEQL